MIYVVSSFASFALAIIYVLFAFLILPYTGLGRRILYLAMAVCLVVAMRMSTSALLVLFETVTVLEGAAALVAWGSVSLQLVHVVLAAAVVVVGLGYRAR